MNRKTKFQFGSITRLDLTLLKAMRFLGILGPNIATPNANFPGADGNGFPPPLPTLGEGQAHGDTLAALFTDSKEEDVKPDVTATMRMDQVEMSES